MAKECGLLGRERHRQLEVSERCKHRKKRETYSAVEYTLGTHTSYSWEVLVKNVVVPSSRWVVHAIDWQFNPLESPTPAELDTTKICVPNNCTNVVGGHSSFRSFVALLKVNSESTIGFLGDIHDSIPCSNTVK